MEIYGAKKCPSYYMKYDMPYQFDVIYIHQDTILEMQDKVNSIKLIMILNTERCNGAFNDTIQRKYLYKAYLYKSRAYHVSTPP